MSRPKVDLKDPALAALLAFLLPGLGHFYQRRVFKGLLYCVCILGTFFTGLSIGHGQVVYFQWKQPENRTYAYLCQFWVGIPALPALAQSQLRSKEAYDANYVSHPISRTFEGTLFDIARAGETNAIGKLTGTIELKSPNPEAPRHWIGIVTGTFNTPDGTSPAPIQGEVVRGDRGGLDPEVAPSPQRRLIGRFVEEGATIMPAKLSAANSTALCRGRLWTRSRPPCKIRAIMISAARPATSIGPIGNWEAALS